MNYKLLLAFLSILFFVSVKGQVNPGFLSDKLEGCAPLVVNFKNTTTGISGNVEYEWDFGNDNTSLLRDAAAVYTVPGNYTVTLHVKEGNNLYKTTQTITVYQKPDVRFTTSNTKGCSPFEVNFTSNSNPGDGSIVSYLWGFGDGSVETGYEERMTHVYTVAGKMGVSLTVTNSFGCQSTLLQKNLVEVLPTLITDFAVKDSFLCSINEAAEFINLTKGSGTLTYQWDFGDGEKSTAVSPRHFYKKAGTYIATLKVSGADGCITNTIKQVTINVQNFKTDFVYKDTLCANEYIYFKNASSPIPTESVWELSNNYLPGDVEGVSAFYPSPQDVTIRLTNRFGGCEQSVSKTIKLKGLEEAKEPELQIENICGAPTLVRFKDTTPGAVAWLWNFTNQPNDTSTAKAPEFRYQYNQTYTPWVTVFDKYGCKTSRSKQFTIAPQEVKIFSKNPSIGNTIKICNSTPAIFYSESKVKIVSYLWDFGDGITSTEAMPKHIYKAGWYYVKLRFKLENGCEGEVSLRESITAAVNAKPDFKADSVNVCGNTPVTFKNLTPDNTWTVFEWHYGDGEIDHYQYNRWDRVHKYEKSGEFDVMLIAQTDACIDTVIKKAYIKVAPPFPKIEKPDFTCNGTRGEVILNQSSREAESWHWDFGDNTSLHLMEDQPKVQHVYTKTGYYKVVLSTKNGSCTVADSIYVPVLMKKPPVLTFSDSVMCTSRSDVKLTVSNLDRNPEYYQTEYEIVEIMYRVDGELRKISSGLHITIENEYTAPFYWLDPTFTGADAVQVVVKSRHFQCLDTSNFEPIKILGVKSGYEVISNPNCTKENQIILKDISESAYGGVIKSWHWEFADGQEEYSSTGEPVYYNYENPGQYYPRLTVTDSYGCRNTFLQPVNVRAGNLSLNFSASAESVSPGTAIDFVNLTSSSDPAHTQYEWLFGDGTRKKSLNASHIYSSPGVYKVSLIGNNTNKNCIDTLTIQITVKFINAAFSYTETYVGAGTCPPVMVQFSNSSQHITRATWDFGDGTRLDGVLNPTHIFTEPGKYYITLQTWSDNGTLYTTNDSITIRGSSATFQTSKLHGCTSQQITLTADVENVSEYFWDFGDGTVSNATDTFAHHLYRTPGIYHPQLVYADLQGCLSSVKSQDKIIIDSLYVSLDPLPSGVCSPKSVVLQPDIRSIAGGQSPQNLQFHWTFGTTDPADTSNLFNPTYYFDKPGSLPVKLVVKSAYGCVQTAVKNITILQGIGGFIKGPDDICTGSAATFTSGTLLPGVAKWKWIFPDGGTSDQQNPSPVIFNNAGAYIIRLIVDNSGCTDTVEHDIVVHANPLVKVLKESEVVCKGASVTLSASGATTYSWSSSGTGQIFTGENIQITPVNDGYYVVTAKNNAGCAGKDSVKISIVHPMTVQLATEAEVCEGKSVQLNATGAHSYQWINEIGSLSNINSSTPLATPLHSTVYTVVGTDANKCFNDTAKIRVNVMPLPQVNAGRDTIILAGNAISLKPVYSSNTGSYQWTPDRYLNCSDCAYPVATPAEPMRYTVTVRSDKGCIASDDIFIDILCGESKIHIPNMFTPNSDGTNDLFAIRGQGVKEVRYLRIYNRFGQLIFEEKNFAINDPKGSWDGMYRGKKVDPGTYIYMAEMSCNDKSFVRKGTVTLTY